MSTLAEIYGMALGHVGNQVISGPDDNSNAGKLCRLHYPQCRDWLLRRFPWSFARRRVVLADTGAPPTNWAYSYAYPSDCLMILGLVVPGFRRLRADQMPPYEVAYDGTRRVIHTDLEKAELLYTARVEDPALFDPMFTTSLGWLLSAEVAMPLSVKPELANNCRAMAERLALSAMAQDAGESYLGPEPDGEFLSVR